MDNMELWGVWHEVPMVAQKKIKGGRLAGMTDINPMWRIQQLTNQFGPCGIGWKIELKRTWLETGSETEIAAFCELALFVKVDGEWSEPIPGIGGSKFVTREIKGTYCSDEAYKMAYTDALSVCCKMLGMGTDVYWEGGRSKYSYPPETVAENIAQTDDNPLGVTCAYCGKPLTDEVYKGKKLTVAQIVANCKKNYGGTMLHANCAAKWKEEHNA